MGAPTASGRGGRCGMIPRSRPPRKAKVDEQVISLSSDDEEDNNGDASSSSDSGSKTKGPAYKEPLPMPFEPVIPEDAPPPKGESPIMGLTCYVRVNGFIHMGIMQMRWQFDKSRIFAKSRVRALHVFKQASS